MRRLLLPGLLALVFLLLVLLALAPARLLAWVLPPGQLVVAGLSGSLWQGSAARVQVGTAAGPLQLGRVDWELSPWSLLGLAPRVQLQSHWGTQRLSGELQLTGSRLTGLDGLRIRDLNANLDADLLRHLAPLALEGKLSVQIARLELRDGRPWSLSGGRLVWQRARWASPRGPIALGSYVLEAGQIAGEPLRGEVMTLEGPVLAAGELQWQGAGYSIALRIDSEGAWDPLVQESLALLASPDGDGYQLQLSGELPPPANPD